MGENLVLGLFLLLVLLSSGLLVLLTRQARARGGPPGWPRLLLGNLLVLLVLLSLGLLGGELYYRFIYDATDSLDYTKVSLRWFQRHYHMNASGCRDNVNYAATIQPGKRRITFLGDSFAAGHGVKDAAALFAFRLREAHPEWEIHLLAQPGFDTSNELRTLTNQIAGHYQFDQVVLVYCLNDIGDLLPEVDQAIQRVYADVEQSGWLRRNSYFVNTVYNRLSLMWNPDLKQYFHLLLAAYRGPVWQEQRQRLKDLRDLVQSHGGRLSVVTFPFFDALGPNYEYQFVHDELDQCWRDLGVPHLDLLAVYRGLPPRQLVVNRFDAHPNERAHALAAAALEPFLQQQLATQPDRH
jgi:hypothetical protein